ncbi:MAG: monofunctional biosynthetic peptidoglycan transglycosylase [Methylotetracoccus sp.]
MSAARSTRWRQLAARICLWALGLTLGPVIELRWLPPSTSSFMLRAQLSGEAGVRYRWLDLRAISPQLALAAIAAEDQRFTEHYGFDLRALQNAWRYNQAHRRSRGGSTITQQTAKNLFLSPHRSYVRKALEAYFSALIEFIWPKRRILEVYLNIAQFGDGIFGAGAASEAFFHKPASQLTAAEAALLVAVLPNPKTLRVDRPSRFVKARRDWVLRQMDQLGGVGFLSALR